VCFKIAINRFPNLSFRPEWAKMMVGKEMRNPECETPNAQPEIQKLKHKD
jgi:hypothetical protein